LAVASAVEPPPFLCAIVGCLSFLISQNLVDAQPRVVLPVASLATVIGALAILENNHFGGAELVYDGDFDPGAFDGRLAYDRVVVVAYQQYVGNLETFVHRVRQAFDIDELADLGGLPRG
jgi:hypothetical protein